jgi:rhodanese-related sulfurtransferase
MADEPGEWKMPGNDYAGDVTAQAAWEILKSKPHSLLVDVRTEVEWKLIGTPDLSSINKEPLYLQWVTMKGVNTNFVAELKQQLEERNISNDSPIYFMCQSGGRSKIAAKQCAELGYTASYNTVTRALMATVSGCHVDLTHRNRSLNLGQRTVGPTLALTPIL